MPLVKSALLALTAASFLALAGTAHAADATPPEITPTITGTLGPHGIYTSDVKVSWKAVDPESPVKSSLGCEDAYVTYDTAGRTIMCSASSDGGKVSKSVTIKRDVTAPVLAVPDTILQQNAPAAGVILTYKAGVADIVDPDPVVDCTPPSGTKFQAGVTKVECTATDDAGHVAKAAFDVIVTTAANPLPSADAPEPRRPVAATPAPARSIPLLAYLYSRSPRYTELKRLTVKHVRAGTMVSVTCKGSSCPKALKNATYTRRVTGTSVNLSSVVKGKLKPGTVLKVKTSTTQWKLTMRSNRAPRVS